MEFVSKGRRHLLEGQKTEEHKWDVGGNRLFSQVVYLFAVHFAPVPLEATDA